jgi:hypothetical protein
VAVTNGVKRTAPSRGTRGIEHCFAIFRGVYARDTTPPVVSNVTPATGGALAPLDTWGCDVTDADSGVYGVTIFVRGRRHEVIYETSLGACRGYTVTATAITNGWRYTARSDDGWPAGAVIYVKATDTDGNEATVET